MNKEIFSPGERTRDRLGKVTDLLDLHIEGSEVLESIGSSGAIMAIAPHSGHLDSLVIRKAVPGNIRDRLVFLAGADYWQGPRKWISHLFAETYPLARNGSVSEIKESLSGVVDLLESGKIIAVYPEGTRGNGEIPVDQRHFMRGLEWIIKQTDYRYPVFPVRLSGLENVMPKGTAFPKFFKEHKRRNASVNIGQGIDFRDSEFRSLPVQTKGYVTTYIKDAIADL
jgi:1-acyl-sn-glycerol-3-phosphate acyltransferase